SQRHRTVLLLADGRRTEAEIRSLAAQAGVPATCFDELLGLSLIVLPDTAAPEPSAPIPLVVVEDSLLPASGTLPPDSAALDSAASVPPPDSWLPSGTGDGATAPLDTTVDQARKLLLRVVRAETPVAGSLTLLRLRRARSCDELMQLLDDVEARIGKRHRSLSAAQTLVSVRRLLAPLPDSSRTAA
ncbi:MAG: hypothetical protein ABI156_14590, partial [Caldimonas sp.]